MNSKFKMSLNDSNNNNSSNFINIKKNNEEVNNNNIEKNNHLEEFDNIPIKNNNLNFAQLLEKELSKENEGIDININQIKEEPKFKYISKKDTKKQLDFKKPIKNKKYKYYTDNFKFKTKKDNKKNKKVTKVNSIKTKDKEEKNNIVLNNPEKNIEKKLDINSNVIDVFPNFTNIDINDNEPEEETEPKNMDNEKESFIYELIKEKKNELEKYMNILNNEVLDMDKIKNEYQILSIQYNNEVEKHQRTKIELKNKYNEKMEQEINKIENERQNMNSEKKLLIKYQKENKMNEASEIKNKIEQIKKEIKERTEYFRKLIDKIEKEYNEVNETNIKFKKILKYYESKIN